MAIETLEEKITWNLQRALEHVDNAASFCQADPEGDYAWGRIEAISMAISQCLMDLKSWQLKSENEKHE